MKQYRIVKFERPGRVFFEVQEKGFLWGWNTVRLFNVFGLVGKYTKPARYDDVDSAKNLINRLLREEIKFTKTVVWP